MLGLKVATATLMMLSVVVCSDILQYDCVFGRAQIDHDISRITSTTIEKCATVCMQTKKCVGFDFLPIQKTCWLSNILRTKVQTVARNGIWNCEKKGVEESCRVTAKRGNKVGTIKTLPKVYTVSFSVKPTAFVKNKYTNVLHFTTGGNYGQMGYRTPAVWFWNEELHITSGVNEKSNYWFNTPKLAKDQWADVVIVNSQVGSKYFYSVYMNGKKLVETENPTAREYYNVNVYLTDPWYPKFPGFICNLMVTVANGIEGSNVCPMTLFAVNRPIVTGHNRLITSIPVLPKVYTVSFSVKPTAFVKNKYTNVLHFTTGGNNGRMGYRTPAVWFWNDELHITSGVSGKSNYWFNTPKLAKDQWADVVIVNKNVGAVFLYEVYLNGKLLRRTTNSSPSVYNNVRVFATDPWYPSFQGELKNLIVTTPGSFTCN